MYRWERFKIAAAKPFIALAPKPVPRIERGAGVAVPTALAFVARWHIQRVLLVTGPTVTGLGIPKPLIAALEGQGIGVAVFNRLSADPTFEMVQQCAAMARQNNCQGIVALGGGSVLDVAKAASACVRGRNPHALVGMLRVRERPLPLLAIPTTAGTGSEATMAAVISHEQSHQKQVMIDPRITPKEVALDPLLLLGLSPALTRQTAADALTHAIESHLSLYATASSQRIATESIKGIFAALPQALEAPKSVEARAMLLEASCLAGQALNQTFVGYVHGFAHAVGSCCRLPHGLACGLLLPPVLGFYLESCRERVDALAADCDVLGGELFLEQVTDLLAPLQADRIERLRTEPQETGFSEEAQLDGAPQALSQQLQKEIVAQAFAECHGRYPLPAYLSWEQGEGLLQSLR